MEAEEHEELRILKEYSKYLNKEGEERLIEFWNKDEREREIARKNGM
jgi:hypothetical protein